MAFADSVINIYKETIDRAFNEFFNDCNRNMNNMNFSPESKLELAELVKERFDIAYSVYRSSIGGDKRLKNLVAKDIFETLTPEQETLVYALIGKALEYKDKPVDPMDGISW